MRGADLKTQRPVPSTIAENSILVRIAPIDGLRALSALVVILSHTLICYTLPIPIPITTVARILFDGALGVRFFFVISGYIITRILLTDLDAHGTISLFDFYKRRFARLFPAILFFVSVTALLASFNGLTPTPHAIVNALTMTVGIYPATSWDYAHLWSLTVEEFFYFAWPALMICLPKRWWASGLISISIACCALRAAHVHGFSGWVAGESFSISFFQNFDQIAVGCFLALGFRFRKTFFLSAFSSYPGFWRIGGLLLIAAFQYLKVAKVGIEFLHPFHDLLQAIAMGCVMASLIAKPGGTLYSFFAHPWLAKLGLWSYSLYLWQQVFFPPSRAFAKTPILTTPFGNFVAMVGMAAFSYYCIELPAKTLLTKRNASRESHSV